jgi:AcrR family transcriptional regulator
MTREAGRRDGRRTQSERREDTRRRLVDSTISHLSEHGFEGFSSVEIAAAAGFTRGAMQHHYSSREDLVTDVVAELSQRMRPEIDLTELTSLGLHERVGVVVDQHWKVMSSPEYRAVIEIIVFSRHDAVLFDRVSSALFDLSRERDLEWLEIFRDSAATADRLHDLRTLMLSSLRGLALRSLLQTNPAEVDRTISLVKSALRREMS